MVAGRDCLAGYRACTRQKKFALPARENYRAAGSEEIAITRGIIRLLGRPGKEIRQRALAEQRRGLNKVIRSGKKGKKVSSLGRELSLRDSRDRRARMGRQLIDREVERERKSGGRGRRKKGGSLFTTARRILFHELKSFGDATPRRRFYRWNFVFSENV